MELIRTNLNLLGLKAKAGIRNFLKKEDGDTNFISIVIILVIVLVVAAVFIGFKDQIMGAATEVFGDFMDIFGNQKVEP